MNNKNKKIQEYSTDGKVRHFSTEEDINIKLGKIIGQKFIDYRKTWDAANRFEIVTEFPLFLHLDMNQECNYKCPHCIIGHKKEVDEYYEGEYLNFKGTKWQKIKNDTYKLYLKNAYRVLLTRARQGMIIFVPKGNDEDYTRQTKFYDGIYNLLCNVGIERI